jgi:signal transduction histidine kinase
VRQTQRLPIVFGVVGVVAVAAGYVLLFGGDDEVTWGAFLTRSVGGSFIACGLIAWQRRPDSLTGPLMTLTGFLFLGGQLLSETDWSVTFTLGEIVANWWTIPFAALVLGFPSGRIAERADWLVVGGFVFGTGFLQVVWLFFLSFPPGPDNVILISPDAGVAETIDRYQSAFNATMAMALAGLGITRWARAAPPLRRLLLPTLAGALAAVILGVQVYYRVFTGEFVRASQELTAIVLVSVPLAFLFGMLRAQLARAGMADLVVALRQAPDSKRLGDVLGEALGDPSLDLVLWLPGFECYVDADGKPVALPAEGSGRASTPIERDGTRIAALIHDAALSYEPDRLAVVCAAADVALERERLQAELESRVEELAGSRARLVEAGDQARRRLERDLHDGAQQRLVSLAIALRMTEDRIRDDPDMAAGLLAAARKEVSESLEELRELARGIHPAVLDRGLGTALESLAMRSRTPVTVAVDLDERLPGAVELAAYFVASEALANVGKYAEASRATIRVSVTTGTR